VRFKILRALGRIAADHPEVTADKTVLQQATQRAIDDAVELLCWRINLQRDAAAQPQRFDPGHSLIVLLLRDKERHAVERIFRLLGLAFRGEDLRAVHRGLTNTNPKVRAGVANCSRICWLAIRESVLGLVDDVADERRLAAVRPELARAPIEYDTLVTLLSDGRRHTLRSLARYHARELGLTMRVQPEVRESKDTGVFTSLVLEAHKRWMKGDDPEPRRRADAQRLREDAAPATTPAHRVVGVSRQRSYRSSPTRCATVRSRPVRPCCGKVKHQSLPIPWCAAGSVFHGVGRSSAKWSRRAVASGAIVSRTRSAGCSCCDGRARPELDRDILVDIFEGLLPSPDRSDPGNLAPSPRCDQEAEAGTRPAPADPFSAAVAGRVGFRRAASPSQDTRWPFERSSIDASPKSRSGHGTDPLNQAQRSGARASGLSHRERIDGVLWIPHEEPIRSWPERRAIGALESFTEQPAGTTRWRRRGTELLEHDVNDLIDVFEDNVEMAMDFLAGYPAPR